MVVGRSVEEKLIEGHWRQYPQANRVVGKRKVFIEFLDICYWYWSFSHELMIPVCIVIGLMLTARLQVR